ncbi:MAG TPA: alginate export family protein [Gammaproteobacteria bacterium]|nr:alginate export family protein [Gammaproteobacteria bacterium]
MLRALIIACLTAGLTSLLTAHGQEPASASGAGSEEDASPSLTISGEHRARYESLDPQYRPLLGDDDQALALRTELVFEAEWPRWRFVGELMDTRAELNDTDSVLDTGVVNTLEPLQLSATRTWTNLAGSGTDASLRIGRMTVDLGSRRLISRNAFRNTRNSYAGVDGAWQPGTNQSLRAFYLVPMLAQPRSRAALLDNEQQIDETAGHTHLRGLYFERPISGNGDRMSIYWVGLDAAELAEQRDLDTFAARFQRPEGPGQWHYDVELMLQTGRSSALVGSTLARDLDHDAYFYHVEIGYSFAALMSPALVLQYDSASGDEDPFDASNEGFDTLYGSRGFDFGPTGIYGPVARANLETPGIVLTLRLTGEWQAGFRYRSLGLSSPTDFWATTALRDASGQSGDSLGRHFDTSFSWQPRDSRFRLEFGAARFSKGEFIRRTAPALSQTSIYYYVQTTVSFLGGAPG